jgi:hypothetical protein
MNIRTDKLIYGRKGFHLPRVRARDTCYARVEAERAQEKA